MVSEPEAADARFMARALLLAERGRGRTSPNPLVGAVIVDRLGRVVGQGAHLRAGDPHAEIYALDEAGPRAREATLYCTLEPCAHVGRTGPCVERIAAAGIRRVVAAVSDPNPLVAGRGVAFLRAHGVHVNLGLAAEAARRLNRAFFTWVTEHRPFVTMKAAVSADGFVGQAGRRVKLTGTAADRWFQRQRAEIDAIAVGSGTVLADDPWLTAREVFRARPLTRVLFDRRARIPPSARVFSTLAAGPVIMVVSPYAASESEDALASLERAGVTLMPMAAGDLGTVLERLAARGVLTLLVEGGPTLQTSFVEAGLVDRVQVVTTPRTLGSGVPARWLSLVNGVEPQRRLPFGEDVLTEFDVHRTD